MIARHRWADDLKPERRAAEVSDNRETLSEAAARMDTMTLQSPEIIGFSDYTCRFCRRVHPQLKGLLEANPDATVGYRHFSLNPRGEMAARAAICAEQQGRFAPMNALLFETEEWQDEELWGSLADQAGVPDLLEFSRCHEGNGATAKLEEDKELAEKMGVSATPTFFYRFGSRVGFLNVDELATLIDLGRHGR